MAGKTAVFIGVLSFCILANLLFSKFPLTVTIGLSHANTSGMQFQLAGIGVPMVRSNGRNVFPVVPRGWATLNLTSNISVEGRTQNVTNQPALNGEGLNKSTVNNSSLRGEIANVSSPNRTEEDPEVVSRWRQEMYCNIKTKVQFSTITRNSTANISRNSTDTRNRTDETFLPVDSLENLVHYNSCAVVSSSHGLRLHTYGQQIDGHDAVLRFNCAPTDKFEEFVGSRTDIRMINTQIPGRKCKKEFWNDDIPMFTNETVVVRNWGTIRIGPQGLDLKRDKFHLFDNLKKFRKTYPNRTMPFIQTPSVGNSLLGELKRFCTTTKRCSKTTKSASTGMLGVVMMLHLCNWVHVYEMVPSNKDNTTLRYYYDEKAETWTKGFHSYDQERQYIRTLSLTPDQDMDDTGVALLKGLAKLQCD